MRPKPTPDLHPQLHRRASPLDRSHLLKSCDVCGAATEHLNALWNVKHMDDSFVFTGTRRTQSPRLSPRASHKVRSDLLTEASLHSLGVHVQHCGHQPPDHVTDRHAHVSRENRHQKTELKNKHVSCFSFARRFHHRNCRVDYRRLPWS